MRHLLKSFFISFVLTAGALSAKNIVEDYSFLGADINRITLYCIWGLIACVWLAFVSEVFDTVRTSRFKRRANLAKAKAAPVAAGVSSDEEVLHDLIDWADLTAESEEDKSPVYETVPALSATEATPEALYEEPAAPFAQQAATDTLPNDAAAEPLGSDEQAPPAKKPRKRAPKKAASPVQEPPGEPMPQPAEPSVDEPVQQTLFEFTEQPGESAPKPKRQPRPKKAAPVAQPVPQPAEHEPSAAVWLKDEAPQPLSSPTPPVPPTAPKISTWAVSSESQPRKPARPTRLTAAQRAEQQMQRQQAKLQELQAQAQQKQAERNHRLQQEQQRQQQRLEELQAAAFSRPFQNQDFDEPDEPETPN